MNTIKRYDAYLTFPQISTGQQEEIRQVIEEEGLEIDVFDNALEFRFEGRDLSDKVVEAFVKIASILKQAEGEIRCEIDDESQDPHYQFFTISESQLWRQSGEIVRSDEKQAVSSLDKEDSSVPR